MSVLCTVVAEITSWASTGPAGPPTMPNDLLQNPNKQHGILWSNIFVVCFAS